MTPNDSEPILACFDYDPKHLNWEIAVPKKTVNKYGLSIDFDNPWGSSRENYKMGLRQAGGPMLRLS